MQESDIMLSFYHTRFVAMGLVIVEALSALSRLHIGVAFCQAKM